MPVHKNPPAWLELTKSRQEPSPERFSVPITFKSGWAGRILLT